MYKFLLIVILFSIICCKKSVEPETTKYQKIAYVSYRDGGGEIYTMNIDGSNQTRLTNSSAYIPQCIDCIADPQFSPDGSKIIFTSFIDGNSEIYIMNLDGSDQINLTNNPARDYSARFSPDGTKIIFVSGDNIWNGISEIYIMNNDGSNQTNLTNNPGRDYMPQYSPDGSKIAFVSKRDGNSEIYIMNIDGSNQENLTNAAASDYDFQFSPDGSKIVFSSFIEGVSIDMYIMNSDGSENNQLALSSWSPVFSPDGSKIAYVGSLQPGLDIFIMNIDGSNKKNLTNHSANYFQLQFSYDGSQILFGSNRDPGVIGGTENTEIYLMDVDGNNQKNLSNNVSIDQDAVFQPITLN